MAFSFGNMLKAAGGNFMKNAGASGGGGSAPILNSGGEDISAAFGPQGGGGAPSMHDIVGKIGQMFGGGGDDEFAAPQHGNALAQLMASMSGAGASALAAPDSLPARGGYRMDPNQPVLGRRPFGFRSA